MKLREIRKYERGLVKEITRIKAVMKETWGVVPNVEVVMDLRPVITADFNIKGFQHKGRKLFLNGSSMAGYRKPHGAVRQIMGEIVDHRNTCECGEPGPSVYQRMHHARAILFKLGKLKTGSWYGDDLRPDFKWSYSIVVGVDRHGHQKHKDKVLPLQPCDAVEAAIYPSRARLIERAIKAAKEYKGDPNDEGEGE